MNQQLPEPSLLELGDVPLDHILSFLDSKSIYSVSKTCKLLRSTVTGYLKRFPTSRYPIGWDYGKIEISRNGVTLERKDRDPVMRRNRTNYIHVQIFRLTFDEYNLLLSRFAPAFKVFHFRATRLTEEVLDSISYKKLKDCAKDKSQTFLFDVDRNDLSSKQLGTFLGIFNPVALHFYGLFNRSIITGEAIPLNVQNLYITEDPVNRTNSETGSCLDFNFFKRILTSWKKTTDAGLILPAAEWEPRWGEQRDDGRNHRRMDIDTCRLKPSEVRTIYRMACQRLGIDVQKITFYNVQSRELMNLDFYNEPLYNAAGPLPPNFQAEIDQLRGTTGKILNPSYYSSHFVQHDFILQFLPRGATDPSESENLFRCYLCMHDYADKRKAVLPCEIRNSN